MRRCMELNRVDRNKRWRKKNKCFWNVVLTKVINDFLDRTNDERKSVSKDKRKKVNNLGNRGEKK